jgi:hypothetical protein
MRGAMDIACGNEFEQHYYSIRCATTKSEKRKKTPKKKKKENEEEANRRNTINSWKSSLQA